MQKILKWLSCFLGSLLLCLQSSADQVKIFVDAPVSARERQAAGELMEQLRKGSPGNEFICDSVGRFAGKGIYITTTSKDKFRKAPGAALAKLGIEGVYLAGTSQYVYIVGNSDLAAQQGASLYLQRLGYRFYFPNQAWHIIPESKNIFPTFTQLSSPSFAYRHISMGGGYGNDNLKNEFNKWERLNLMPGWMQVDCAHAYYYLLIENRQAFEKNPQFMTKPLVNGGRQAKAALNYANSDLVDVTYKWVANAFDKAAAKGQRLDMRSLDPFDGNNFCGLPECLKIGSVSDQVFSFTNKVAAKLQKSHPGKKIGMLAYYDHIDIPKFPLQNNIFVMLTNGYNTTRYSIDELIQRWKTKVKQLGIYDYLAIYAGSSADLPGKEAGGKYKNLAATLRRFHKAGIIAYEGESTHGWLAKGLGHYLIARLTWDINGDAAAIADEFFRLCFPQSQKYVKAIFDSWNDRYLITDEDFYIWFTNLRLAFEASTNQEELERINQLALYLYYVKLHQDFMNAPKEQSIQKGMELCAFLSAIQPLTVVPSFAALNILTPQLGKGNELNNKDAAWKKINIIYPKNKNEWLSFIDGYVPKLKHITGIVSYSKPPFLTKEELKKVPATFTGKTVKRVMAFSGKMVAIVDTRNVIADSLFIRMSGGTYKKTGSIGITVYQWNDDMLPQGKTLLSKSYPADGNEYVTKLSGIPRGRYIFSFTDGGTLGVVYFPENMKFSYLASEQTPIPGGSFNSFSFYVPPGTKKFYITKVHFLQLYPPDNKQIQSPTNEKLMEFNVSPTQWGWWRALQQRGQFHLSGIPPLVSRDPNSFLWP